ncbi:MAG: helix-hairpin-helix domain-containing protein, partial [Terriglobia bacterium]
KTREKLRAHGVGNIEELAAMTPEQLTAIPGIGEKMVQKIAAAVKQHFEPGTPTEPPADKEPTAAGATPVEEKVAAVPPERETPTETPALATAAIEKPPAASQTSAEPAETNSQKVD